MIIGCFTLPFQNERSSITSKFIPRFHMSWFHGGYVLKHKEMLYITENVQLLSPLKLSFSFEKIWPHQPHWIRSAFRGSAGLSIEGKPSELPIWWWILKQQLLGGDVSETLATFTHCAWQTTLSYGNGFVPLRLPAVASRFSVLLFAVTCVCFPRRLGKCWGQHRRKMRTSRRRSSPSRGEEKQLQLIPVQNPKSIECPLLLGDTVCLHEWDSPWTRNKD